MSNNNSGYSKIPRKHLKEIKGAVGDIGSIIQERRNELGYTQEEFAEKLGLSPTGIQCIERGARSPSLPTLLYICKKLKLSLEIFEK